MWLYRTRGALAALLYLAPGQAPEVELAPLQILLLFVAPLPSPGLGLLAEKPVGIGFGLFLTHFSAWWLHEKQKTHISEPQPDGEVLWVLFIYSTDTCGGGDVAL